MPRGSSTATVCEGSFQAFFFFDVADEIQLDTVSSLVGGRAGPTPEFRLPAPSYVRFVRPPLQRTLDPIETSNGRKFNASIKYFDHGVVSLNLEFPFVAGWDDLIAWSNQLVNDAELEKLAAERVRYQLGLASAALLSPYAEWLDENYWVLQLKAVRTAAGTVLSGEELIERDGPTLTQIVRGETMPLSSSEQRDLLASAMSFYPSDLLLVGWQAAIVYDSPEGAAPLLQLIEYANVQLIEYRYYDETLSRVLDQAYDTLESRRGVFSGWGLAKEAERLDTLRLDIRELAEHTQNAIKFLSDMYYARAFQLATVKIGAADYRALVESKLQTAGELYQSMVNEFREMRSFLLEVIVVVILIVELIPLIRGGH